MEGEVRISRPGNCPSARLSLSIVAPLVILYPKARETHFNCMRTHGTVILSETGGTEKHYSLCIGRRIDMMQVFGRSLPTLRKLFFSALRHVTDELRLKVN